MDLQDLGKNHKIYHVHPFHEERNKIGLEIEEINWNQKDE